jgi:hypothetical protein
MLLRGCLRAALFVSAVSVFLAVGVSLAQYSGREPKNNKKGTYHEELIENPCPL